MKNPTDLTSGLWDFHFYGRKMTPFFLFYTKEKRALLRLPYTGSRRRVRMAPRIRGAFDALGLLNGKSTYGTTPYRWFSEIKNKKIRSCERIFHINESLFDICVSFLITDKTAANQDYMSMNGLRCFFTAPCIIVIRRR